MSDELWSSHRQPRQTLNGMVHVVALRTVRIEHPDVPDGVVINKTDFDPKKHVEYRKED